MKKKNEILIRTFNRRSFPEFGLWQIPEAPSEIYVQGTLAAFRLLEDLPNRGLAVVGTRTPQPRSVHLITRSILDLSGSFLVIISGFAKGIDATAHRAALRAGLPTIAILGAGLDFPYPNGHQELREEILAHHGLLISEFEPSTHPHAKNFLRRNRLISGLSKATIVVEASHRSGALNTARWARDQDRYCFAVPCFPGDPALAGNQKLLDEDHALGFWGIQSLGAVWLEFSNWKKKQPELPFMVPETSRHSSILNDPKYDQLIAQVSALSAQSGGAQVQQLLDWALERKWSPQYFFQTLQTALNHRHLIDENGLLLKNLS